MDFEKFINLSKIKINYNEKTYMDIERSFKDLESLLSEIKKIDLSDIKESIFYFEWIKISLRKDIEEENNAIDYLIDFKKIDNKIIIPIVIGDK